MQLDTITPPEVSWLDHAVLAIFSALGICWRADGPYQFVPGEDFGRASVVFVNGLDL